MIDYQKIKEELAGIAVEDNPALMRPKSRDFYWYSPVLKAQLDAVVADLVVTPKTEEEVIRTLRVAYAHGAPVTARGAGTGNYGQAMPLSGGIVLHLTGLNRIKQILPGRIICDAGVTTAEIDRQAKAHSGQELRFHPSTTRSSTIGGFIAGGSGGVGSITWGGLRDLGNIIRLRVVTMEAEPKVLELSGWDLHKVSHAYGTNGIITEVEMPLAPAYDWVDVLVGYDDFLDSARYADALAKCNGILIKELAPIAAPLPEQCFSRHKEFIRPGQSVVIVMVAPHSIDAFCAFTSARRGEIVFRSDQIASMKGIPPAFELAWNHTTMRALKIDPSYTYLQILYPGPDHLAKVEKMSEIFGDEVQPHLEFIKFDGTIQCTGLSLLRYSTEARLDEIIGIHQDNGCLIFNPHRYTLEEGGMKQTDRVQLEFKRQTDPKGLLNPGKMIAWENPDFDFSSGQTYLFPGLAAIMEGA